MSIADSSFEMEPAGSKPITVDFTVLEHTLTFNGQEGDQAADPEIEVPNQMRVRCNDETPPVCGGAILTVYFEQTDRRYRNMAVRLGDAMLQHWVEDHTR